MKIMDRNLKTMLRLLEILAGCKKIHSEIDANAEANLEEYVSWLQHLDNTTKDEINQLITVSWLHVINNLEFIFILYLHDSDKGIPHKCSENTLVPLHVNSC